jgi:hypothetical protein
MAKRKRLRRRRFNLTEQEFVKYACSQCNLCRLSPEMDVNFCYDGFYVVDQRKFIKEILRELQEIRQLIPTIQSNNQVSMREDEIEYTLEYVFCESGLCDTSPKHSGVECPHKIGCMMALRMQILNKIDHHGRKNKFHKKNKKGKSHQKYIPPTPKFFCNAGFREEVNDILNGDNLKQQDKGEECTRCNTATADRQVADS